MADVSRDRAVGDENSKVEGVVTLNTMAAPPLASCICCHINNKLLSNRMTRKSFASFCLKARCFT